jgi:hypothetical protein
MQQCNDFVHDQGLIPKDRPFFSNTPHPDSAYFIVAWILDKCVLLIII